MAATYPADVADAAKWSKANPKQQGDAAAKAVESQQGALSSSAAQSPSNWRMFRPALGSVRYISPFRST
jgi:hypothetical protein